MDMLRTKDEALANAARNKGSEQISLLWQSGKDKGSKRKEEKGGEIEPSNEKIHFDTERSLGDGSK